MNGAFGLGSGPIFLSDVQCGGLEERLFDCSIGELEESNCGHNQDAAVTCKAGMYLHHLDVMNGVPLQSKSECVHFQLSATNNKAQQQPF